MVWVGRDPKGYLFPIPAPQTRAPSTGPSVSKFHPKWMLLGMGHPQLLWETHFCILTVKNCFPISDLTLLPFSLRPFPHVLSLHALVQSCSPAASAHCWVMLSFPSINTPKPFLLRTAFNSFSALSVFVLGIVYIQFKTGKKMSAS